MKSLQQLLLVNRTNRPNRIFHKLFLFLYRVSYQADPRYGILPTTWYFYITTLLFPITFITCFWKVPDLNLTYGTLLNIVIFIFLLILSFVIETIELFIGKTIQLFNPFSKTKKNRTRYMFYFIILIIANTFLPLFISYFAIKFNLTF